MILTCPSCTTRFSAPDAAFAEGARKVRCSQCKHAWRQEPPEAEAGDGLFDFNREEQSAAPSRQQDSDAPSDSPAPAAMNESNNQEEIDALFESDAPAADSKENSQEEIDALFESDAPAAESKENSQEDIDALFESDAPAADSKENSQEDIDALFDSDTPAAEAEGKPADDANGEDEPEAEAPLDAPPTAIAEQRKAPAGAQGNAGAWVGWSVLVSIVVAALAAMTLLSETVVGAWPPAKRVYAMVGLPFSSPGDGLEIRNLEAHFEPGPDGQRLIVMGDIVNVSRGAMTVPMIRVVLRDAERNEIEGWLFRATDFNMMPSEAVSFRTAHDAPPATAVDAALGFAGAETETMALGESAAADD